jgi:hypothetical protein
MLVRGDECLKLLSREIVKLREETLHRDAATIHVALKHHGSAGSVP